MSATSIQARDAWNDEGAYHKQTNIPTSSCQRFDEWFGQQLQTNKSNDKKCN
jgi:hypothetical protein